MSSLSCVAQIKKIPGLAIIHSDTGNRTPGYRVRGDNVSHYTISDPGDTVSNDIGAVGSIVIDGRYLLC